MLKVKHDNGHIEAINAYAPIQPVRGKYPEEHDSFYNQLEAIIKNVRNLDKLVIIGDFNTKDLRIVPKLTTDHGPLRQGHLTALTALAEIFLDFSDGQNFIITNTLFNQTAACTATWRGEVSTLQATDEIRT